MSSTLKIKVELANLPYREMRELGKDFSSALKSEHKASEVPAAALSNVMASLIDSTGSQEASGEQEVLAQCFSRKRIFTIQPYDEGWKITTPTLDAVVYATNIREGISQMIDQIVAIKILSGR